MRIFVAFAVFSVILAGCGSGAAPSATSTASGAAATATATAAPGKVALLLPEKQTARYEAADRPFFEAKFKSACPGVEIIYSNASESAATQQQQAEAAITNGAKVLVLDPVDGDAAGVWPLTRLQASVAADSACGWIAL